MNAMRRRDWLRCGAALAAAATVAPWLGGCGAEPPLTVAWHPWPGYAPLKLAESLGWWDDGVLHGLPTGSASASRAALREGRAHAAALTLDEVLQAVVVDRLPLRVVALFDLSHGADVVLARPTHAERSRWRGARLGHEQGAVGELMAASWLEYAGLQPDDVTMVHLGFDEHERAWREGAVDLLITFEPVASRLQALGAVRLFDSSQLPEERPIVDVLAVHREAAAGRQRALTTLLQHLFEAQRHLMTLREDSIYRLAPWLDLPRHRVMPAFSGLHLTGWSDNRDWLIGTPARLQRAAEGLAQFMRQRGLLREGRLPANLAAPDWLPVEEPA